MQAIITNDDIIIKGQAYDIKDTLKSHGAWWNPEEKYWYFRQPSRQEIKELINVFDDIGVDASTLCDFIEESHKPLPVNHKINEKNIEILKGSYPKLMIHQVQAVATAVEHYSFLIGDEPGLGKTFTALAYIDYLIGTGAVSKGLVICPASIKRQWQEEALKWLNEDAIVIEGDKRQREELYKEAEQKRIVILNYELLQREDVSHLAEGAAIVFDEASRFKNSKTKTFKTAKKLCDTSSRCLALTGTPVENSLQEFWALINFLNDEIMPHDVFREEHLIVKIVKVKPKEVEKIAGCKDIPKFIETVSPIYLRRTKQDVRVDMPEKIEYLRVISLTEHQKVFEEQILDYAYKKEDNQGIFSVLVLLRLVADDLRLLEMSESDILTHIFETEKIELPREIENFKIDEVLNIISEHGSDKIIIFTQFSKMAKLLLDAIPGSLIITGATKNKSNIVNQFKNDSTHVLIATDTLTYGTSIDEANVLVNFDLPWSVGKLIQRSNRIHRINSSETKYVYNLVSDGAEQMVLEVLSSKIQLFKDAVEGHAITDVGLRDELIQNMRELARVKKCIGTGKADNNVCNAATEKKEEQTVVVSLVEYSGKRKKKVKKVSVKQSNLDDFINKTQKDKNVSVQLSLF